METASKEPYSIHHVNFPTTDPERTTEWYAKVFGMKKIDINRFTNTKVLLLTRGKFDLHFTPVEEMDRMAPYHYAIEVEDLLGRDPVAPDLALLTAHVRDKVVMITGAGGSIGSELSRQLLELGPKALILSEQRRGLLAKRFDLLGVHGHLPQTITPRGLGPTPCSQSASSVSMSRMRSWSAR